jgi:hypothetical protein
MREQNEQRQKDRKAQDQETEVPYSLLQGGRRNIGRESRCDRAESGSGSGLHQQHGRLPGNDGGARKQRVMRVGGFARRTRRVVLARRKGLARQDRFVELEFLRLQHDAIGRNEIASRSKDDIARHQRTYRQGDWLSVVHDVGVNRDGMTESLGFLFRAVFLHDVERHGERQHGDDDEEAAVVAADAGNRSRRDQKRDEGIENALAELDDEGLTMSGFEPVRAVNEQALLGFLLRQPDQPGFQFDQERVGRFAPKRALYLLHLLWSVHR